MEVELRAMLVERDTEFVESTSFAFAAEEDEAAPEVLSVESTAAPRLDWL